MVKNSKTFSNWLAGALLTVFCAVGVASAQEAVVQVSFANLEQMLQQHAFTEINRRGKGDRFTIKLDPKEPFEVVAVADASCSSLMKWATLVVGGSEMPKHDGGYASSIDTIRRSTGNRDAESMLGEIIESAELLLDPKWADGIDVEGTPFAKFAGKPLLEAGDVVVRVRLLTTYKGKQYRGVTYAILTSQGMVKCNFLLWEFMIPH